MSHNGDLALALAGRGLACFPCYAADNGKRKMKTPLVKSWRTESTTDQAVIRGWWGKFPAALPAIDLGKCNLVVIDADRHGADDEVEALNNLLGANGGWPDTPIVETPRDGLHLYFRQPDGQPLGNGRGALPAGIDVRGAGGYVIAGGARLPDGREWRLLSPDLLPERAIDGHLLEVLRDKPRKPTSELNGGQASTTHANGDAHQRARHGVGERERRYALAALDGQARELAKAREGTRNEKLNAAAFRLGTMIASGWISRSEVEAALWEAAIACGYVASDGEPAARKTLMGGIDAGLKNPHPNLPPSQPHMTSAAPEPERKPADGQTITTPEWPDLGKGGVPIARSCANARAAIEALGIECQHDVFHDRKLVGGHAIEQWTGELSDHAVQVLRVIIKKTFNFDPGRENTHDAAVQLCLQRRFDPVCDYLDSLQWDGTSRIDTWLATYLGAENTPLAAAIGRLTLMAAVRRARKPGCKFDEIIVLEGPEGSGKSTAIETMAGKENFSDQTILGLGDREQQEAVRGVWLYEIADLAGMSKADVDRTKAFASRLADRARPAYGRQRVELPRRCVFFATTNNETYLKSQTGNRRFWPVKTNRIDLTALRRDRDQLWAEAARCETGGEALRLPDALWSAAALEQDKRRDHDPWDDILASVQGTVCDVSSPAGFGQEERIATADLMTIHLKLPADRANDAAAKRLGFCMARLRWTKAPNMIRIGGKQQRGYVRPVSD